MSNNTNTNTNETKRGPGAPSKTMVLPPKKQKFTIAEVVAANPDIKAVLTIRNRVEKMVSAGELVFNGETIQTGKAGAPSKVYWRASAYRNLQNLRNKKVKLTGDEPTEPTEAAPVEVGELAEVSA
jgi:hypothetical protein